LTPVTSLSAQESPYSLTENELENAVRNGLLKVNEFVFIREQAEALGVRVYLFGGTAASFAHYVKWDAQRMKGDRRFQADRFDYDYSNIFRSTQDLDIVVDGDVEKVSELHRRVIEKFRHAQGSKEVWDFRPLRRSLGEPGEPGFREALLNDPNFLNQHTDSQSTGLIEISKPDQGEGLIRDARDWTNPRPHFFQDILFGKIHFYFSELHETTARFQLGINPSIFSVIRFLTKAFQYELEITGEDLAKIKTIIDSFDPQKDVQNAAARAWLEKNGKKLLQHAVNLEYAVTWLDKLGLRKKLRQLGQVNVQESLAWWMNKEPLRSFEVGTGQGQTAKALGLNIVAHETMSMFAYESITRAHTGKPNVLVSRAETVGEAAKYGDGFYTQVGKRGARGTGLTIRFKLNPQAREGTDFLVQGRYLVILNKTCLRIIQESLNISPVEYFNMLKTGSQISAKVDLGLMEKFRRKVSLRQLTELEHLTILDLVKPGFERLNRNEVLVEEWIRIGGAEKFPKEFEKIRSRPEFKGIILENFKYLAHLQWTLPELTELLKGSYEAHLEVRNLALKFAITQKDIVDIIAPPRGSKNSRQGNPRGLSMTESMVTWIASNFSNVTRFDSPQSSVFEKALLGVPNLEARHFEILFSVAKTDRQILDILSALREARFDGDLIKGTDYRSLERKYVPERLRTKKAQRPTSPVSVLTCNRVYKL
jgi:hypothetical protein